MERAVDTKMVRLLDDTEVEIKLYKYLSLPEKKKFISLAIKNAKLSGKDIIGDLDLANGLYGMAEIIWAKENTVNINDINIADIEDNLKERIVFLIGKSEKKTEETLEN